MNLFPRIVTCNPPATLISAAQTRPDRPIWMIVSIAAGSEGGR
jgi:hypothetical protein